MADLDSEPRIYGSVSLPDARKAADVLEHGGWNVRKAGFAEFEIRGEDLELYIESGAPVLIHGSAMDPKAAAERLAHIFRSAGIQSSFEVYDASGKLDCVIADE